MKIKMIFEVKPKEWASFVSLIQSQPRESPKKIMESVFASIFSSRSANNDTDGA